MHLEPYAFFDDAGKWHDRDFICLCGYMSDGERWQLFTERWQKLVLPSGLGRIHMTNFYHEAKKLGWSGNKPDDFLLEAASIIREHIQVGFAVGLDAKHYRSLPSSRRGNMPKPHVACLQRILKLIKDRLNDEGYEGRISFVLDEEEGSAVELYRDISRLRKSRPELGTYIGAVCFADDEFYVPLQASDMLANLSFGYLRDRALGNIGSSEEDVPEVLKSLLVKPSGGDPIDIRQELWGAKELDEGIDELLGRNQNVAQIKP
jgi:hypothetical protein